MTIEHEIRDVAIIGAGPVGLFAIFECGMVGLKCHVIDALDMVGGQCAALYPDKPIYDIPGYPKIGGAELIENLKAQAAPFNPRYHLGQQVCSLKRDEAQSLWYLTTSLQTTVVARSIIIAAGVGAFGPHKPPLAGIESYENKSVFYFVKDRSLFDGKRIVIAGGGDSAVDWALALVDSAAKVMVVHRRDRFRAAPDSEAKLKDLAATGKIELVVPYQLSALHGENGYLETVEVKTLEGETRLLEADGLLAFFGLAMTLGPIAEWGLHLERNHIQTEFASGVTNQPNIYAIGDIATYPHKLKLILSGFAEAAQAAHAIRAALHPDHVYHFEYSTTKGVPLGSYTQNE